MEAKDVLNFLEDVISGSAKSMEILGYLRATANLLKGKLESEKENDSIIMLPQSKMVKKVNSVKPKGDIELKNIQYRITDRRYIGRKQIKGHLITVYGKTQKECAEKLKAKINEVVKIDTRKHESKQYLFKDLFMQWYKQEKEPFITLGTQKDILLVYKQIEPLHEMNIKKINKQTIYSFLNNIPESRSKEKVRLYLNACLKYYHNEGLIIVNPCANVKVKKSNVRKTAFSYEQQTAILEHLKNKPLKIIILIYLITGLRKNELNFKSIEKDIDFENRILKAVNLKGRNFVKRYKQIKLSKQALKLIMNNVDIIHKYNAELAYREFATVLKELKISGSIVNCRHTFATNCFYLEKQDLTISREMGHARTQITKDVYTDIDYHLSKEKMYKLYNNLYNEN